MVLSANPIQDIAAIRNLKMVFKGGNRIDTNPPEGQVDLDAILLMANKG